VLLETNTHHGHGHVVILALQKVWERNRLYCRTRQYIILIGAILKLPFNGQVIIRPRFGAHILKSGRLALPASTATTLICGVMQLLCCCWVKVKGQRPKISTKSSIVGVLVSVLVAPFRCLVLHRPLSPEHLLFCSQCCILFSFCWPRVYRKEKAAPFNHG
jgi:hypothetical protein